MWNKKTKLGQEYFNIHQDLSDNKEESDHKEILFIGTYLYLFHIVQED